MIMDSPKARWDRKLSKRRVTPQELRDLSRSSHSPNLFDFLLTASHNAPIHCSIPECLIHSTRINPTLLCSQNCLLQVYTGSHSFNKFFERVDLARQTENKGDEKIGAGPQYVVKGSGCWQLCMNKEECWAQWPKAEYVRRYVQGDTVKPAVYRFKRSRNSINSAIYLIKNTTISHNPRPQSLALQRAVTPTSIYQHDTFAFVYAGKLLKASFSPYYPYPSLLSPRSTPRPSSQAERPVRLKTSNTFHLVDTQHLETCKVSLVTEKLPALEAAASQLIVSLEAALKSQVVSLELDYIRLDPEHYLLIDLLSITLQSRSLQPMLELRSKFARVTTPSPVSPRLSVPDWRLLPSTSPRLSLILSDQAALSPEALNLEERAKGQLQGVEKLYDGLMARVRRAKVEQRDLVQELEMEYGRKRGAEALVDRFFHAFILKSEVTALYENKLKQDFDAMKAGILLVLRGRVPLTSRKRIRATHCKIEDLSGLVKLLCRVAREEGRAMGIREELIRLIAQRLEDFLEEIASLGSKAH